MGVKMLPKFDKNYMAYSPMEQFQIYPLQSQNITVTNQSFYLMIAGLITIQISGPNVTTKGEIISTWWGIQNESQYRTILIMIENNIGSKYTIYLPMFYTIFHVIQFSNLLGMVPYSTTTTVEIIMTQTMSQTQLQGIILIGILTHNILLFAAFLSSGTPLALIPFMVTQEIAAYFIKILSQGLRQAINLITGHVQCKVIIGFIYSGYLNGTSIIILALPLLLLTIFLALEQQIAYLQAFIFVYITCITLKDMAN